MVSRIFLVFFFCFKQKTAYEMRISDWSSDVCSSDLATFDPLELDRFSTLQQLSRALGESAADMSSLQGTLDDLTHQYETLLLQQSRVSSDLDRNSVV